jgi:hypothetical protein
MRSVVVAARVAQDVKDQLGQLAKQSGSTKSKEIAKAVAQYLGNSGLVTGEEVSRERRGTQGDRDARGPSSNAAR